MKHIAIAIKADGVIHIDQLQIERIAIDNQAHRLLLRRANEQGTTITDEFENLIRAALREYIAEHPNCLK